MWNSLLWEVIEVYKLDNIEMRAQEKSLIVIEADEEG